MVIMHTVKITIIINQLKRDIYDRNINTTRLLVPVNTGNRLHREPKHVTLWEQETTYLICLQCIYGLQDCIIQCAILHPGTPIEGKIKPYIERYQSKTI